MKDVSHSIRRIRHLALELNHITEEANRAVAAVEKILNEECSIGVPCEVEVGSVEYRDGDKDAEPLLKTTYLAYARVHGKFRVAVNTVIERARDNSEQERERIRTDTKVWSSSTREDKLAAFPKLPALLHKIEMEAGKLVDRATSTSKSLQDLLGALGSKIRRQVAPIPPQESRSGHPDGPTSVESLRR